MADQSTTCTDKLIILATHELGVEINTVKNNIPPSTCDKVCDKLFGYAKEDGHNIMNTSKYDCNCRNTPYTELKK